MPEHIYFTIDMDGFDPAVAPGVGTPEPGGLSWFQFEDIVSALVRSHKKVVGADIVEFSPQVEGPRTMRLAARVALRVLQQRLEV